MAENVEPKPLSKIEKAAVILLCMDEKATGELFNQMEDEEIKRIAGALMRIHHIPALQIQGVLQEFAQGIVSQRDTSGDLKIDGSRAVENLISRSLSRGRGQQIMSSISENKLIAADEDTNFQELIQQLEAPDLYELISGEHPQIISIALSNAKKAISKEILNQLSDEMQVDVISRMARLEKVSGRVMDELRTYLTAKINEKQKRPADEVKVVADLSIEGMEGTLRILKTLKRDQAAKIVAEIQKVDSELAKEIEKRMFVIEDLERANDVGIRELLRNITNDDLKVALKDTPDALKQKFFSNMSERASMILREDMEVMGPLKVEEIETAQQNILQVAKEMMKEEKLTLSDLPDDEV